jgi:hypothetical protein
VLDTNDCLVIMADSRKVYWISASRQIRYRYERPRRTSKQDDTAHLIAIITYTYQIERYNGINIPIVISEYGAGDTTESPRTFAETPTIYSPEMTEIFSGGCVYQFWQGSNNYGLALFEPDAATYDRRNTPKAGKVAEKRESDIGNVLLFEDFKNYKAQLAVLPRMPTGVNERSAEQQNMVEAQSPKSWNFEIEGEVPESCVDWSAIEEGLKSQD